MSIEQELRAVFGDAVLEGTPAEYLTDFTRAPGSADAVVLPATADEVAAVLAWCYERDVPIVPRGGGTGAAAGAVPDGGVVLALDRLTGCGRSSPSSGGSTSRRAFRPSGSSSSSARAA